MTNGVCSVFHPLLALDLHLSVMTRSIGGFHALLADEFLPRNFAIEDVSKYIEGELVASLGRNLPVTDSDSMIAKVEVFRVADVVTRRDVSSQRTYSPKEGRPFLIDGNSVALVVGIPNVNASFRRTKFGGPDEVIKCL